MDRKENTERESALIEELVSQLTLEEKIHMIHGDGIFQSGGVERLGIPPLKMSDGPMGVRNEFKKNAWITIGISDDMVSYLPSNSAIAATWNREIAYEAGRVLGAEARGRGKDVILAPGINIKRSPLCGRNFEYMSEDPKLVEEMAVPLIRGIQENDVAACVKHFVCNNQETERLWVDTYTDERTLREIYYPGFKAAIDRGETYTLMGAYNLFRGEHCSQSKYLLTDILREEWHFDGAVISDWGAIHDTKCAAESGLDLEMSVDLEFDDYYMANPLIKAVKKGKIQEAAIDKKVRNILRTMLRLRMLGEDKQHRLGGTYNAPEHRRIVLDAARESVALLKNENNCLPICRKNLKTLAVIGQNAVTLHANGGGSAEIKALYEISPLMGLKTKLGGNVEVKYAPGYYVPDKQEAGELNWQHGSVDGLNGHGGVNDSGKKSEMIPEDTLAREKEKEKQGESLLQEAIALAEASDQVIIVGGLNHDYDSEGADRKDMILPYDQDILIEEVLKVNPNAVVVIMAGSPVQMDRWSSKAKAIVWSWYAGMEGGTALAEVLLGEVNPSGKLPESIPQKLSDSPAHKYGEFGTTETVTYKEGIYVGYRYYDTYDVAPAFCFGHGMSYTTFTYSSMEVLVEENSAGEKEVQVTVKVRIRNDGTAAGAEVVQIYVADIDATVDRPKHELKGFSKVFLEAGEEKETEILLGKEAFGFYDGGRKCFVTEPGEFEIQAGSSSRDIRSCKTIRLTGEYQY